MNPFLYFPYGEFKKKQKELIEKVFEAILKSKILFLEAPSGFGKTISLLTGAFPFVDLNNAILIFVARTYRELDRIVEEIRKIPNLKNVKFAEIRAKREFCINSNIKDITKSAETFNHLCAYAIRSGQCFYFENFKKKAIKIHDFLKEKRGFSFEDVFALGVNLNICPYELNSALLYSSNVILLTYTSLMNQWLRAQISELMSKYEKKILILDEAHNLLDLSVNYSNIEINLTSLIEDIKDNKSLYPFIFSLINLIENESGSSNFKKISSYEFYKKFVSKFGLNVNDLYDMLVRQQTSRWYDTTIQLYNLLINMLKAESLGNFYVLKKGSSLILGFYSFEGEKAINDILSMFDAIIFSSATLRPIEPLLSKIKMQNKEFDFFDITEVDLALRSIVIRNLTTRYVERNTELYASFAELISEASIATKGGLAIFVASSEVMKGILYAGLGNLINRDLLIEDPKLDYEGIVKLVENFNEKPDSKALLAIQGGRISEGEDFSRDSIKTVIIIGIPFEEPSPLIKEKIDYYEKIFPGKGLEYAYILPAIRKVIQSIGRAMRREGSNLNVILADGRYCSERIFKLLPSWLVKDAIVINYVKGKLKRMLYE